MDISLYCLENGRDAAIMDQMSAWSRVTGYCISIIPFQQPSSLRWPNPPLSPAHAAPHFLWSDSFSDKQCKPWQIKIVVWWGDIPTPPPLSRACQVAVLCGRKRDRFLHPEGRLPLQCSRAGQEQHLLMMAPSVTHSLTSAKPCMTAGRSLCWNVLAGWQLAWHSAASRLPAQDWRDQKVMLEEADEFWGFMILMRRKWCAFG